MQQSLTARSGFLATVAGALTLREDVVHEAVEDNQPFARGLKFVVAIALIVAVASVAGAVLTEWTSPDIVALRDAINSGLQQMPWWEQIPPEAIPEVEKSMEQQMDLVFRIIDFVSPSIPTALIGIVLQPIGMALVWLVFGLLAYIFARLLDGTGTLPQTYGATALAAAPYLLGVVHLLPYVQAAGISTWAVICAYVAIKHTHGLTPARAFWATLLPLLAMAFLAILVGAGVGVAVALTQFGEGGIAR